MIQNIKISKLFPHPNNPRQDLGDLTELAESIKAQGILQNLTVVGMGNKFKDEEYTVIIGHRRLAAAKLAGLTEVPCSIAEMDKKTQIATMLLENIQRTDLTIYEQAHGFQLMMEFGETIASVSEKTGFSETTVRRRVKLMELDQDKFKKSMERGATLMDYADLEKIEDITLRNTVLDKIGTPNFKWELQNAITKEANEKILTSIIESLEKFATKITDNDGFQYVRAYYPSQNPTVEVPSDADTVEYYFKPSNYGSVDLYKKFVKSQESITNNEKYKEQQERRAVLDAISDQAYRLRYDFIREISNTTAKKNIGVVIEYSIRAIYEGYTYQKLNEYADFLGIEVNESEEYEDDELDFDSVVEYITAQPEKHLLIAAYLSLESSREHYYDYSNRHLNNEPLNIIYDFLGKLGYEMSDEEKSMRDGTHKLFIEKESIK